MPTLDARGPHYVVHDQPRTHTAALAQLRAAGTALRRALDCDRHLIARSFVDDASALLELAAEFCPARSAELLALAGRLEDALECVGWFPAGTVKTILDEAEAIERALRGETP